MNITDISAAEILDSRGNPTVQATVVIDNSITADASVPSGASTGSHEVAELRDNDERYDGKGVLKAVASVNGEIKTALVGHDPNNQAEIDQVMIQLDGTEKKSRLGANAILAVSLACARAAALANNRPLYQHIAVLANQPTDHFVMPVPMVNILNGGRHAAGASDFQEYIVIPHAAGSVVEAVRWGSEIFHTLGEMLTEQGLPTAVGDEGGFAPALHSNDAPLDMLVAAVTKAGYQLRTQVSLGVDVAASELFVDGQYQLASEKVALNSTQMLQRYQQWRTRYPIVSIEDGIQEDDWDMMVQLTQMLGQNTQLVGDDLFVTNPERLQYAINRHAGNAILIKPNQIGTLWETLQTIALAQANNYGVIISHRSGETEDTFIADLAVGTNAGQIKTGSLSRSERMAKYNRLMEIERELGAAASFASFKYTA